MFVCFFLSHLGLEITLGLFLILLFDITHNRYWQSMCITWQLATLTAPCPSRSWSSEAGQWFINFHRMLSPKTCSEVGKICHWISLGHAINCNVFEEWKYAEHIKVFGKSWSEQDWSYCLSISKIYLTTQPFSAEIYINVPGVTVVKHSLASVTK